MAVDGKYRRAQFPVCFCAAATDRSQQVSTTFQYTISKTRRRTAPLFFIFHLLRVSRCIFEFRNKKVPKKKPGLSGEKTVWQKCFFFNFFRALKAILRIFWVESHLLKCFGSFPALMHTLSSLHFCHARSALSVFFTCRRGNIKKKPQPQTYCETLYDKAL